QNEKAGVHQSGKGAGGAVANVGGGARYRSRRGKAAKQRVDDIGDALSDQLLVGIVLGATHAVGDHGGQQRFDRSEQGDREGRPHQRDYLRKRQRRQRQGGQRARDSPERGAYRSDP